MIYRSITDFQNSFSIFRLESMSQQNLISLSLLALSLVWEISYRDFTILHVARTIVIFRGGSLHGILGRATIVFIKLELFNHSDLSSLDIHNISHPLLVFWWYNLAIRIILKLLRLGLLLIVNVFIMLWHLLAASISLAKHLTLALRWKRLNGRSCNS